MARPKGSKNKSTLVKELAALSAVKDEVGMANLSDGEIFAELQKRFGVMNRMTDAGIKGDVRGVVISGASGIGKTFTVEQKIGLRGEQRAPFRSKVIKGSITPIGLYKMLYKYRSKGEVIVLDDSDTIFFDDQGMSLLKAALDSSPIRTISWYAESNALKNDPDHDEIPQQFDYHGTMIFITNTDFQGIVDKGGSTRAPHFNALMSRAIYVDLKVHTPRAIAIWVNYLVGKTNMLVNHYGISRDQQKVALAWIMDNYENMRTLSLRDAMKVGQFMKSDPTGWEELAEITLLRFNG
jgi:hypothetical protein